MVTLKDIAEKAEVSVMTVSNVINNNHLRVSKETFDKVTKIIEELEYVPNANARSLIKNQTRIIALYIPSYNGKSLLDNAYNSFIVGAVEKYVQKYDFNLMLVSNPEINEVVASIASWNVAGLIALSIEEQDVHILESRLKMPVVLLDSYYESSKISNIGTNDYEGGRLAGKYLTELGHRKIAFASGPELMNAIQLERNKVLFNRYKGFMDALAQANISKKEIQLIAEDISYEGGIKMGKQLLDYGGITAVFCTSDALAAGVIEGAKKIGLSTPKDVSVMGFDDMPIGHYITPKLTTIRQQNKEKGERAVDMLMESIKGKRPKSVKLEVELIERNSILPLF